MSGGSNIQPNWHPDFKIVSTLPDTRVVRTNFIAKSVIYAAIFIIAAIILQREYQAYKLSQIVQELEQQVQGASSADLSRLEKSEQFRKSALKVREVQRFFKAPFVAHDSIVELARAKPEGLTFTRLVLSELVIEVKAGDKSKLQVAYKLSVSGNVQDLPLLTQFKRKLEESQFLNLPGYSVGISENIDQRDVETGIIPFQVSALLKPVEDKINTQ
jgi:hypothetical protein